MSTKHVLVPRGFIVVDDNLWGENIVRMKDGMSLRDCHDAGECPKDCPLCIEAIAALCEIAR